MVAPAGAFFPKELHISIFFDMTNCPKVFFFVKNSIFGVINHQNINIFGHILGPLTNDPFIKKFKIAAKAQPGIGLRGGRGSGLIHPGGVQGQEGSISK